MNVYIDQILYYLFIAVSCCVCRSDNSILFYNWGGKKTERCIVVKRPEVPERGIKSTVAEILSEVYVPHVQIYSIINVFKAN